MGASAGQFTRGPGETRLEANRRVIRTRVSDLRREIEQLRRHRSLQRHGRRRIPLPLVSLVGYTNAGKSSLLNALTAAGVLAEDQLFATLDPTTRGVDLPDGGRVLLTDTVGFIRKLPHSLVAAFRATLEEVAEADLLLHIIDVSSPLAAEQAAVVQSVLSEAGAAEVPMIPVLNKIDLCDPADVERIARLFPGSVAVSAQTRVGVPDLLASIAYQLRDWREEVRVVIPYALTDLVALLHERGEVSETSYGEAGVTVTATVDRRTAALVLRRLVGRALVPPGTAGAGEGAQ
jgi:GTP-binding protein HflX